MQKLQSTPTSYVHKSTKLDLVSHLLTMAVKIDRSIFFIILNFLPTKKNTISGQGFQVDMAIAVERKAAIMLNLIKAP